MCDKFGDVVACLFFLQHGRAEGANKNDPQPDPAKMVVERIAKRGSHAKFVGALIQ